MSDFRHQLSKMTWVEKYRPTKFEDIIGQSKAIEEIKKYIENFPPKTKKRALLLNGSPGIGKTTLVQVLAKELKSEIYEINASDVRNKATIEEKLKPVLEQTSLFRENKLVLIDEIDGVSSMKDRGGVTTIKKLIENSPYPIICTANDAYKKNLSDLRKVANIIDLKDISPSQTKDLLKKILEEEKKEITLKVLNQIAINANGDLRSAINDLESASSLDNPEEFEIGLRSKKDDIFNIMKQIFQNKADAKMMSLYDKLEMPIDEIILWIEENIPKVYKGKDLAEAYRMLALVDTYKGRIHKQQYWRFLVYENIFLSYGISEAKNEDEKKGFFKYTKPERILKIWLNNQKHAKKKTIAQKYAKKTHVGFKRIMREWNEISKTLANPIIQTELKLDEDEISYIMKYQQ